MSVNARIKEVRKELGLSQAKFAKDIAISNGYIAAIELENRETNERIIKLVCSAYGVSQTWLKTGEGEMFDISADKRMEQAMRIFRELKPEFQDYVLQQIDKLLVLQDGVNKE